MALLYLVSFLAAMVAFSIFATICKVAVVAALGGGGGKGLVGLGPLPAFALPLGMILELVALFYVVGLFADQVNDIRHGDRLAGIFHCKLEH